MITLEHVYLLTGVMGALFAVLSARDRTNPKRLGNAAFWGLLAASFLFGSWLGDFGNGLLVLGLVLVGGLNRVHRGSAPTSTPAERAASAARRGNALFLPALVIPIVAVTGTLWLKDSGLVDPRQATLVFLALGVVIALVGCYAWLRPPLLAPIEEGRRLIDAIVRRCSSCPTATA